MRDFVKDKVTDIEGRPQNIKVFDKIAFTLGVLNICCAEYYLVAQPAKYWMWYSIIVPIMLITRWKHFKANGMQYFLLDFCYMVNIFTFIHLYLLYDKPYSEQVFRVGFILTTGPLPAAVPVWMNSLVFHDVDRTVSVYIHTLPMCLYYTLRTYDRVPHGTVPLNMADYGYASLFYVCWQAVYWLQTEVVDKDKLEEEALLTSLKWLSTNTRNALSGGCLRLCRRLRLFAEDETFQPQDTKTKLVFVTSQAIFTGLAMVPTYWCWQSPTFNIFYICVIFTTAIYFGGSYYVDVFSKKYALALEKAAERAVQREVSRGGGAAGAEAKAGDGAASLAGRLGTASQGHGGSSEVDEYPFAEELDSGLNALLSVPIDS